MSSEKRTSHVSRPTTLNTHALVSTAATNELTIRPQPPRLSVSPADSLSKASSENLMSALSALPSPDVSVQNQSYQFNRQLPLSASNLSVNYPHSPSIYNGSHNQNFIFPSNPSSLAPSPTRNSLNESLASSINDLTVETEQLERAIRHNDTRFVRRMLELYHNKFVFTGNIRSSFFDKSSLETRSVCAGSQHDKTSLFKSRSFFDRKESDSTAEPGGESPAIFTNALHLAIESNAFDVTVLLLKSSFDPNEAGVTPFTSLDIWRRRSDSSYESAALAATNGNNSLHVCRVNSLSASREQLIPHSVRSTSPHLLSPVLGQSVLSGSKDVHHFIRFSVNSSLSSANSEVSSIGRYSTPTKVVKMKSELSAKLRTVHLGGSEEANPVTYEDEYTRDTLYALPPIFLATALNNAPILRELIKFGANVNISDRYGVTPLHLSVCQERISRSCVHTLIQSGAKTNAKNKQGVTPCDLLESRGHQLTELQKLMVDNAFSQIVLQQSFPSVVQHCSKQQLSVDVDENSSPSLGLLFEDGNSTSADVVKVIHPEEESESGEFNVVFATKQTTAFNGTTSLSANKSKLLKKLKTKTKRTKSQENTATNTGPDVYLCFDELSSDGPSHSSIHAEMANSREHHVALGSTPKFPELPKMMREQSAGKEQWLNKAENSIHVIIKMASNIECIPFIIKAFQTHLSSIVTLIDKTTISSFDKLIATLLNRILQTIVDELCGSQSTSRCKSTKEVTMDTEAKVQLSKNLCSLLKTSIGCLRGGQSLQYTALLMINKVIDVLIVKGVSTVPFIDLKNLNAVNKEDREGNKNKTKVNLHSTDTKLSTTSAKSGNFKEKKLKSNLFSTTSSSPASLKWIANKARKGITVDTEARSSVSKSNLETAGQTKDKFKLSFASERKSNDVINEESHISSLLNILLVEGSDLLLNVLNNAITLHKRVTGSKQTCTPSHRWRHCTYHCLQILSARALLFISQTNDSRSRFVDDGPLKVLLSSLDSTHDPQLLCLVLQIMASIAIDPLYQKNLVEAELPDILMQLILPSDEWFYTNHSTKYARYVKHHAARILVYMGLEKRLRNKVYLFDLLEEPPPLLTTPSMETEEDIFIARTSLSPFCVFSDDEKVKGASMEGMVLEILMQIEKKIVLRDSSEGDISLCDGNDFVRLKPHRIVPPAIQVDFVSSKESSINLRSSLCEENDQLSPLFYLSTFPMCVNPLIFLRLLQHRMFGCVSFWSWPSNAVSRSSVASSYESRSRAGSTCGSNIEEPPLRTRRNVSLTITCPGTVYSPSRSEIDRRASLKSNAPEERIAIVNIAQISKPWPSVDRSLFEKTQDANTPVTSPNAASRKSFKFSSFKRKRAKSNEKSSPPTLSFETSSAMQADIAAFQRELQNIPRNETSPIPTRTFPPTVTAYCSSMLSSYIQEALERSLSPSLTRPRSCSVPRTTFEGTSLQLPVIHHRASASGFHMLASVTRSTTCEASCVTTQVGRSPSSLSPNGGRGSSAGMHIHCGESPASSGSGRSAQHREEVIMPNSHRAILRLMMDWARIAASDLRMNITVMKELNDFLARISVLGDQYQWRAEEIRILVDLQDTNALEESNCQESTTTEYLFLQQLLVSGNLPCSKEEAAILAGIQLRIEETSPVNKITTQVNSVSGSAAISTDRQSSVVGLKLRPICEDVKETSPIEYSGETRLSHSSHLGYFERYENEDEYNINEQLYRPRSVVSSASSSTRDNYSKSGNRSARKSSNLISAVGGVTRKTTSVLRNWVTSSLSSSDRHLRTASINLRECLPPMYHNAKGIAKAVKEQKRKLFHSQIYESEIQLKKLYLQTCKRLPAFGCQIFQVKEILRGKTTKLRVTRLLGLGIERIFLLDSKTLTPAKCQSTKDLLQWQTGGGRSHDRLILEFRTVKWSVAATPGSLRAIGNTLWTIMQDVDGQFLNQLLVLQPDYESQLGNDGNETGRTLNLFQVSTDATPTMHYKDELEALQSILHFPEEVALRLSELEYELFYSVSPVDYIRHITVNAALNESNTSLDYSLLSHFYRNCDGSVINAAHAPNPSSKSVSVQDLVKRFNEVSSWITHLIISQPTHDDRRALLSCIIRVAQSAWNLGAFNTALEIVAGLKSDKLRPFWLSIKENETPVQLDTLTKALLFTSKPSPEYREAVQRALNIPQSKVIPFFGSFLKDLYTIFKNMPSLVVLPTSQSPKSGDSSKKQEIKLDFASDFQGEDHFMSRIGVGGIVNVQKMKKAQQVIDNIKAFHFHAQRRQQLTTGRIKTVIHTPPPPPAPSSTSLATISNQAENAKNYCKEDESLYEIDLNSYVPIEAVNNDHGVSFIPTNSESIDLQSLQTMHHGCTVIHFEEDTGRAACVYLKLEVSNGLLAWCKPVWSGLKTSANTTIDYNLAVDIEDTILSSIIMKHDCREAAFASLDEGFIDLLFVKEAYFRNTNVDYSVICRRFGLHMSDMADLCFISLLYGTNLSDNRIVHFIMPRLVAMNWSEGLKIVIHHLKQQKNLIDQRILWLKNRYLQLYYENGVCVGPTPAEAIKVFGGRKWTLDAVGGSVQSTLDLAPKRASSFGIATCKLRKKKSTASLTTAGRDSSPRSQTSVISEVTSQLNAGQLMMRLQQSPSLRQKGKPLSIRSNEEVLNIEGNNIKTSESSPGGSMTSNSSSSIENLRVPSMDSPQIHTSSLISAFQEKLRTNQSSDGNTGKEWSATAMKIKTSITHSSQMNFVGFMELFRSFLIRSRKDIKDLFEQLGSKTDIHSISEQNQESSINFEDLTSNKMLGLLTRNFPFSGSDVSDQRSKICDAIAAASIVSNCAGVDTLRALLLTAEDFQNFLRSHQQEELTLEETKRLIATHEPDVTLRQRGCLSFEGFVCYLMDKDNFAFTPEQLTYNDNDMNEPLSHYYIATSHNTYLTGHQLKGESSVELYSQVLLTGCRCVELDCWDGDDGLPVIYHGHTLTSKIPFKKVVETINEKAFVASPFPVILSIENHCSLQQQAKMAQIFISVFGEKLVTKFLFEADFSDEPQLPSPNQLRYRILIKNKKLRAPFVPTIQLKVKNIAAAKFQTHRTNSLVSAASTGSLNEDEDDYEDDDDDDEQCVEDSLQPISVEALTKIAALRTESSSSQEGGSSAGDSKFGGRSRNETPEICEESVAKPTFVPHHKVVRKSSSQVAPELSDLVIYCQAIKFRGFTTDTACSPTNTSVLATQAPKKTVTKKVILSPNTVTQASAAGVATTPVSSEFLLPVSSVSSTQGSATTPTTTTSTSTFQSSTRRPQVSANCYQVASLNEHSAKKLCRKHPLAVISYTESQLMRSYPAGMRIDSSNFNPVIFWAFGMQLVALNFQTEDTALSINKAMFEQNGSQGYVLKPKVMRDKSHVMYTRFNPWDKEFDGFYAIDLTVQIISGQYVCGDNNAMSPQVEIEIIGIPVDCNKQRTKLVQRNSLNPIFNDTFVFRVTFVDLAFIRFAVFDVSTNHVLSQRVVPIKALRPGYRHLRLNSVQNQPLPLSSLFIYTSSQEEGMEIGSSSGGDNNPYASQTDKKIPSRADFTRLETREVIGSAPVRRRMFFLVVHGVIPDEPSTILKITQESTTMDVINQALAKANKANDNVCDYVLIEEVGRSWQKRQLLERNTNTQRILDPTERPLEAQAKWKGEGRFVLKKIADDPSSRAWMTTIKAASMQKEQQLKRQDSDGFEQFNSWTDERLENFLVCVYNVSQDQPYAILKASANSTAQDIISQALLKARRLEDPKSFILMEEISIGDRGSSTGEPSTTKHRESAALESKRILDDNENVYLAQAAWKGKGLFRLVKKDELCTGDSKSSQELSRGSKAFSKLTRTAKGSLKKLNKFSKQRLRDPSMDSGAADIDSQSNYSSPQTASQRNSLRGPMSSETENEGFFSDPDEKSNLSFSRLKRLSLRRLKVWR